MKRSILTFRFFSQILENVIFKFFGKNNFAKNWKFF